MPEPIEPKSDSNPAATLVPPGDDRFRLLVESVSDHAIFLLDLEGCVASWNAGAERIKGWTAQEIVGRPLSTFFTPDDVAAGRPELALATARRVGRFESEGWRVRKDGTGFWAHSVLTALHDRSGVLRGFSKVTRDLTERRRTESLEHGRRRMNDFLAVLAHELRNPLAPIRNALSVMTAVPEQDPDIRECREVMERQLMHLTHLVDDLLDVSRVTTGKIKLRHEPLDLREVVSRAVEGARPMIDERRHALEVDIPAEPVVIEADATRLVQIFVNLLNNAAKYTPPRGRVRLTVAAEQSAVVVRVKDDGVGISAELLPRVFDLFTQGNSTLDRAEGGLGIGLTLVRWLTELHGGSVAATSAGPGEGSEFTVRLPRTRPGDPKLGAGASESRDPPVAPAKPAGLPILVVDDNRDSADTMAMLLRAWGHDVRTANDGPSTLDMLQAFRPSVVLLDIGLPGMNGLEVAERIKALPGGAVPTLIAMTGYSQESDRRRTAQAGFAHHLVKPIDGGALKTLLGAIAP